MTKATLRTLFLEKRKALTPQATEAKSKDIARLFFDNFIAESTQIVHCFLPIVESNEVNTWLIVKRLFSEFPKIKVVVPSVIPQTNRLNHYLLTASTPLTLNKWGIAEPNAPENKIEDIETLLNTNDSVVVVPLLVFDKNGHRVGYGKGFYDVFLSRISCPKVGLSLFEPIEKIEDTLPLDVALDSCISPNSVYTQF